jgi:hypothetical protein
MYEEVGKSKMNPLGRFTQRTSGFQLKKGNSTNELQIRRTRNVKPFPPFGEITVVFDMFQRFLFTIWQDRNTVSSHQKSGFHENFEFPKTRRHAFLGADETRLFTSAGWRPWQPP